MRKVFTILLIFTAAFGCKSNHSSKITFSDNFENGKIADFWRLGDYGSGRFVPESVSITNKYKSIGNCVKLHLEEGYIKGDGGDGHFTERTELDSGKHPFLNKEVKYTYSLLIPKDFPIIDNRLVISQIKQSGLSQGPLIAQRFRNGRHYITIRDLSDGTTKQHKYELPELVKETWHTFIIQVYFSNDDDGYITISMNGKKVVSFTGKTAYKKGKNKFYHKIGLYRDQWQAPMSIYFDDYMLTNNKDLGQIQIR